MSASNLRERRQAFRFTPDPLAVINFHPGIARSSSTCRAAAWEFWLHPRSEDVHPRRFRLSFKSIEDAKHQVSWYGRTRQGGESGVRFTHLPEAIRGRLALWMRRPALQTVDAGRSFRRGPRLDRGKESEDDFFTRSSAPSLTEPDPSFAEDKPAPSVPPYAINILTLPWLLHRRYRCLVIHL